MAGRTVVLSRVFLGGFQLRVCAVLFRDSKPKPNSSALSPPAAEKTENVDFSEKRLFGTSRETVGISPRECVFRNQRGRFSPLGVQNKGVMEKGWIFDEKC